MKNLERLMVIYNILNKRMKIVLKNLFLLVKKPVMIVLEKISNLLMIQ